MLWHTYIGICISLYFLKKLNIVLSSRNYNPVERRGKGGKDRNVKSSLKNSKSLQTNIMNNPASGNTLNPNKTSGWVIGIS